MYKNKLKYKLYPNEEKKNKKQNKEIIKINGRH